MQKILLKLIKKIDQKESVSSSHWNKYHRNLHFGSKGLRGLEGFGNTGKNFQLLHKLFQKKFRKLSSQSLFFEKIDNSAQQISRNQKRAYNLDILRQTITLDFLNEKINFNEIKNTIIIGDGFGTMTTLLLENNLTKKIFLINLRKTLLVDLIYLQMTIGEKRFENEVLLIDDKNHLSKIEEKHRVIAIEAENYHILKEIKKDLVLNIASFQEMDMKVIKNYFKYLYNQTTKPFYFYLCNREEKFLPDKSIIKFKNYPFKKTDLILIDELCPWHQYYYTFKPPFKRYYDGPTRHQLRKINLIT